MQVKNQIQVTDDYSWFKFSPLNRKVSATHVAALKSAMKKQSHLDVNPIIVDKEGQILSGQHRFLAAKELRHPIYYIVKELPDNYILEANTNQKACTLKEAIDFYAENLGNEDYKLLSSLMQRWAVSAGTACGIVGNAMVQPGRSVISGKFSLRGTREEIQVFIDQYQEIYDFMKTLPLELKYVYRTKMFGAGLGMFMEEGHNWERFMRKVRINWEFLDCHMPTAAKWKDRFIQLLHKRCRNRAEEVEDDNETFIAPPEMQ